MTKVKLGTLDSVNSGDDAIKKYGKGMAQGIRHRGRLPRLSERS